MSSLYVSENAFMTFLFAINLTQGLAPAFNYNYMPPLTNKSTVADAIASNQSTTAVLLWQQLKAMTNKPIISQKAGKKANPGCHSTITNMQAA